MTEDLLGGCREATVLSCKPIELFAGRSSEEGDSKRESERAEYRGLDLCDLKDAGGMLVNISSVEVVVPHESLNPAELGLMSIVKLFCDDSLKPESKDVSAFSCMIVKAIADAVQKIEAFLEFGTGIHAQGATTLEFVEIASIKERVGDPDQVMKISHAPRAFLQIGLLEENRRRELMVTSLDVAFSLLKKTESVFDYAFLPEPVAEFLGKCVVTTEQAVIK